MANYTLNYTGEKVDELLNKIDTAFGEETVMGDTLTWDGNTEELYNLSGQIYHISGAIPTLDDLQNGGSIVFGNNKIDYDESNVMVASDVGYGSGCYIVLAGESIGAIIVFDDDAVLNLGEDLQFEKLGTYLFYIDSESYTSEFKVNGYTNFAKTVIKHIPSKYIPQTIFPIKVKTTSSGIIADKTFEEIVNAHNEGLICILYSTNAPFSLTDINNDMVCFAGFKYTGSVQLGIDAYSISSDNNCDYYYHTITLIKPF